MVKYESVTNSPGSVTSGTTINITNPYASRNCIGVILKSGGGNGGYAQGSAILAGNNIRFYPGWTDTNVTITFTVLYTD